MQSHVPEKVLDAAMRGDVARHVRRRLWQRCQWPLGAQRMEQPGLRILSLDIVNREDVEPWLGGPQLYALAPRSVFHCDGAALWQASV
eukprot:9041172-Pyramimonas_sp.AAC.1